MKRLQFVILFLLAFCCVHAQKWDFGESGKKLHKFIDVDTIDVSQIECIYQHTTLDTYLQEHRSEFDILLVGKQWAKYMNHNNYICDSLLKQVDRSTFTINDYYEIITTYSPETYYMLTQISNRKIEYHDYVPLDFYTYEDSVPDMNWILYDDTMTVCDHLCHMAVTNFRGRIWKAWYCDLPIYLGPWKFSGLPGLIIKVQDSEKEHVYEAVSLKQCNTGIYRAPLGYEIPTTRERFNKALASYKADPFGSIPPELIPKATDAFGNPVEPLKRLFYNPMEKE